MNKGEHLNKVSSREYSMSLDFIARNILYLDRPHPGEKEVTLENMMIRLGGTRGEIENISRIKILRQKKLQKPPAGIEPATY